MAANERRLAPFWLHQIAEYLIALTLLVSAWYSPEPAVQATLGALILINAVFADGAAGAFPHVSRRVHKWFDVVIMAMLLFAAFQGWFGVGTAGRLALPLMSALMLVLWINTDFGNHRTS